jgi:septal ring factor EnvC (AmiA/AmiB activator)
MGLDELNQFGLLEEKIESLISLVGSLSEEKVNLERNMHGQEKKIGSLTKEIETLEIDRDVIRKRIETLLEKINEFTV